MDGTQRRLWSALLATAAMVLAVKAQLPPCPATFSPLVLPNNSTITEIPNNKYDTCSTITSVTFSASIEEIGKEAFRFSYNLTQATFDLRNEQSRLYLIDTVRGLPFLFILIQLPFLFTPLVFFLLLPLLESLL